MTRRDLRHLALTLGATLFAASAAYFAVTLLLDLTSDASLPRVALDLAGLLGCTNIAATLYAHHDTRDP